MRSDDAGESWREVSADLPSDFGFPIDVHAHEPDTIYVVCRSRATRSTIRVGAPVTLGALLDALEARYPVLRGTMRDHDTRRRRPLVRFYACEQDLSNEPADHPLPAAVVAGDEPFLVVGAMAGG